MFKLEPLIWDTDFFGYTVYQANGSITSSDEVESLLKELSSVKAQLAYHSTQAPIQSSILEKHPQLYLADEKVTYAKKLADAIEKHNQVDVCKNSEPTEQLLKLAIASGQYSRFKLDKHISQQKFEELYTLWIKNAVSGSFGKAVLVFKEANTEAGFVTINEHGSNAAIGIIAVDKAYRGKKIGSILMQQAEKWAKENGYNGIQVATQRQNIAACGLYESRGYTVHSLEYLYHIWLETERS